MHYETIPIITDYIEANQGYDKIINELIKNCEDDDYIIISETPLSTAEGNLVDESEYHPSILSIFLCDIWSKYLFGYIISPLLKDKKRTIDNLRKLPKQARNHKEFILKEYGLRYALMPTSEAGVDLSNVPEEYVSLLPTAPNETAKKIKEIIKEKTSKNVHIIIIDTDATYQLFNYRFTALPKSIKCIKNNLGIYAYLLKSISKPLGPTILASTVDKNCDYLIRIASICEEIQLKESEYFFDTVYSMEEKFNTKHSNITVEMLHEIKHIPSVIFRIK